MSEVVIPTGGERRDRLSTLEAEIGLAIAQSTTLPEILNRCTEAMLPRLDATFAGIWTLNRSTHLLELQAFAGEQPSVAQLCDRIPFDISTIGFVAQHRQPYITPTQENEAFTSYPLIVEDRLVGLLVVACKQPVSESVNDLLCWAANAIAVTIDRTRSWAGRESLLFRLASQIRNSLELNTILETAVQEIHNLLQLDWCLFMWYKPQKIKDQNSKIQHEETDQETSADYSFNSDPKFSTYNSKFTTLNSYWEVVKEAKNPHLPTLIGRYPAQKVGSFTEKLLNLEIIRLDDVAALEEPVMRRFLMSWGYASILTLPIQTHSGAIGAFSCGMYNRHLQKSKSKVDKIPTPQELLEISNRHFQTSQLKADKMPLPQELLEMSNTHFQESQSKADKMPLAQKLWEMSNRSNRGFQVRSDFADTSVKLRPWSDSEVELLRAVADQLAIAIDQAELYSQARNNAEVAQAQAQQIAEALHKLQTTQTQLIQTEKMSSLGSMVAGVAHEINNPINFISGNLTYAIDYIKDLLDILQLYQKYYPKPASEIEEKANSIELEFLTTDLPKLISSMKLGTERISQIVLSLRNFSRLDESDKKPVNLHDGIDSTLLILQHKLKSTYSNFAVEIVKEYGNLPLVECCAGQLNQVFMNIISNAIDALENQPPPRIITIKTAVGTGGNSLSPIADAKFVVIRISDNGPGMAEPVVNRSFDPFFTTKPVGKGTGLGLSISHHIVVEKHGGILKCSSKLGQGAEFWIQIPLL